MTEDQIGAAWREMAATEGHVRAFPPSKNPGKVTRGRPWAAEVQSLVERGLTCKQAADRMGMSPAGAYHRALVLGLTFAGAADE